ncbi:MAG TPA: 50S ribosomal protein L23 [Candidatus Babeliales bacterium]|jgi:large subunit ribosomal protein L23|nr:50S ribosomal protein L23 [Candidatus Babeliales bacterium]
MDLNVFEIIKGPVISEKATLLNQKLNKFVLKVHPQANKVQIKEALQRVFNVKVEKVNTLNRVGKSYRVRRTIVQGSTTKRVFVTLKKGYSIDIFGQTGKPVVPKEAE